MTIFILKHILLYVISGTAPLDKIRYIGSPLEIRENFMFNNMAIWAGALQVLSLFRTSPELHGDSFREDHV